MAKKIAVVTGANRGLGLGASRELAKSGFEVILTSRDETKGKAAAKSLQSEGLDVVYHQLDTADEKSVETLKSFLKDKYEKIDVIINNAGVYKDDRGDSIFDLKQDVYEETMRINVWGPFLVAKGLVPLLKGEGQVVNVSSGMGQLSGMAGGSGAYRLSKVSLNGLTRMLQSELEDTHINVNSVCPGWVRTDMGGSSASRSIEQGVETIVWLAKQGSTGPRGQFLRDKEEIEW